MSEPSRAAADPPEQARDPGVMSGVMSSTRPASKFDFASIALSIKSATSRIGSNMGVNNHNLEALKTATTNVASNVASNMNMNNITSNLTMNNLTSNLTMNNLTSNLTTMQNRVQGMASLENLQDGFQASVAGIQSVSAASLDGLQTTVAGLEGLSKTIMDNIAEKKKELTNVEALKAKGNYQLIDTIKSIEYQILLIFCYFILALFINWYLVTGVTQTVDILQRSRKILDDPELEKKLRKYSDLNQIKEGMDGLRNEIAQKIQDGASVIRDNIALENFNILSEQDEEEALPQT